jgi:hypothetical protein
MVTIQLNMQHSLTMDTQTFTPSSHNPYISSEYLPPVMTSRKNVASPKLAPSNVYVEDSDMDFEFDSDERDQIEEKAKCCVCVKSNLMQ